MSEQQQDYTTQPAAIIDPPRVVRSLQDGGLADYQVWGWVKTSAKFRAHIRILRGAKHDIWHYLALGVDEFGKCKETIKEICEGTGYSHTEVINTLRELDEMGYLSIQKGSKGNVYTPEFVARGERKPTESAVKKVESTPVYQVESTPSLEESPSIPLRVKRVNNTHYQSGDQERPDRVDEFLKMAQNPALLRDNAIDSLLSRWSVAFLVKTTAKDWRKFAEYAIDMRDREGWEPDKFIEWVKRQEGYPQFWSRKRMEENYPKAFAVEEKDWQDRSHAL